MYLALILLKKISNKHKILIMNFYIQMQKLYFKFNKMK